MDIGGFLLILGASARLTRLVTRDEIFNPLRTRAGDGWFGFFLVCPYCVGLWLTAATAAGYAWLPWPVFMWGAVVLSANLLWAVAQELLDTGIELHRERSVAVAVPRPMTRGRGARTTSTKTHNHGHSHPHEEE